jgi:hypothetical protein
MVQALVHHRQTTDFWLSPQTQQRCRRRESNPRPSAYETPALTN